MNAVPVLAAMVPGPPIVTVAIDAAAPLAPAGLALAVLAIVGAAILLGARDPLRTTSARCQPRPESATVGAVTIDEAGAMLRGGGSLGDPVAAPS